MLSSVVVSAILSHSYKPEPYHFDNSIEVIAKGDFYDDQPDEDYGRRPQKRYSPREQSFSTLGGLLKNQKQLGAGLLGIGALLTVMGMMLFFEGTLLRLGNVRKNDFIVLSANQSKSSHLDRFSGNATYPHLLHHRLANYQANYSS